MKRFEVQTVTGATLEVSATSCAVEHGVLEFTVHGEPEAAFVPGAWAWVRRLRGESRPTATCDTEHVKERRSIWDAGYRAYVEHQDAGESLCPFNGDRRAKDWRRVVWLAGFFAARTRSRLRDKGMEI